MSDRSAAGIRRLLEGARQAGLAPGFVAGWTAGSGRPVGTLAVGRSRVDVTPGLVSVDTWFDLASLTKPLVVGTLSLLALRDQAMALDTKVRNILTELSDAPVGHVTVHQLLTHTSGLPSWVPLYALAEGSVDRLGEVLAGLDVDPSGTQVVYSCPGFIVLGLVLERVCGHSLDELFHQRVVEPLSLTECIGFRPGARHPVAGGAREPDAERAMVVADWGLDPHWVPPCAHRRPDDGNARFLGGIAGNAGLFGTVAGVMALAAQYLPGSVLLTDEEIGLAVSNHTSGLGQGRGLGWQLAISPGCSAGSGLSSRAFGHTGFTGTSLWVDPARASMMVLLGNRVHPGHRDTDLHPLRRRFHQLAMAASGAHARW